MTSCFPKWLYHVVSLPAIITYTCNYPFVLTCPNGSEVVWYLLKSYFAFPQWLVLLIIFSYAFFLSFLYGQMSILWQNIYSHVWPIFILGHLSLYHWAVEVFLAFGYSLHISYMIYSIFSRTMNSLWLLDGIACSTGFFPYLSSSFVTCAFLQHF